MTLKKTSPLTAFESYVINDKGTEKPFTGEFNEKKDAGTYVCRKCGSALYRSQDKFASHCGWPSFDDAIPGAVLSVPDADGLRTEIVCNNCKGHLGHVFVGEGFTSKNTRHCVNSVSMMFEPAVSENKQTAVFASGCFWGTEYHFAKAPGVLQTEVGYCGGHVENPTYEQVCNGTTGHLECLKVVFDANKISYEKLLRLFFETHDFSQKDGQGPDIGPQYLSAVFPENNEQKATVEKVIGELKEKSYFVATQVREPAHFWAAEDYHQKYYFRNAKTPYCHIYRKIF